VLPKQNDKQQPGERKWHGRRFFPLVLGQYEGRYQSNASPRPTVYYVRTTGGGVQKIDKYGNFK